MSRGRWRSMYQQVQAEIVTEQTDQFFAMIEVGYRVDGFPCVRCGRARTNNEVAAYGDRCEVCWCIRFPARGRQDLPRARQDGQEASSMEKAHR